MSLQPSIARVPRITAATREEMLELHRRHYANVRRDRFMRDLAEKDWAILLRDDAARIAGFSTLQVFTIPDDTQRRTFVFSGDTVVEEEHRRSCGLAGSFGHFMLRMLREHPDRRLFWFLISKGYRTYRFLPVFFNTFFPTHACPTPAAYAQLLRAAGTHKFGAAYDSRDGLIRLNGSGDRLRGELAGVPERCCSDPHVRFFLQSNPRYARGDELACIADIAPENLNTLAWRAIKRTTVTWDE